MPEWFNLQDPLTRKIVLGAVVLVVLVFVARVWGGLRNRAIAARRRRELRRNYESIRLQQEEIKKLADQIEATSSTSRIAGFAIVRQIDTVFSEGRPSSQAAVELAKALAAQKGGNAIINLQIQQGPNGKWFASGDTVIVKAFGRSRPASDAGKKD